MNNNENPENMNPNPINKISSSPEEREIQGNSSETFIDPISTDTEISNDSENFSILGKTFSSSDNNQQNLEDEETHAEAEDFDTPEGIAVNFQRIMESTVSDENYVASSSENELLTEEELSELRFRAEELSARQVDIETALTSLDQWIGEREKSYVWNLNSKLKVERVAAELDSQRAEFLLNSINIPTPEQLKFVSDKALHRLKIATLAWLAASIGIWLIKQVLVRATQILLGDTGLINSIVSAAADWMSGNFMTYAWLFMLTSYLIAFIGSFVAHYRDWSNVARSLDKAQSSFQYAAYLETHTHNENQRLVNLHRHTLRVLRILAKILRNPYQVPIGVDVDPSVEIDDKTLPLSVRFGVAKTGNRSQLLKLRRQVLRRMVRKSWRSNSYLILVRKIASEMGYDEDEFNIDTIDRTLSSDSDGMLLPFEASLKDVETLDSVGSQQFEELSNFVREEIVPRIGLPIGLLHQQPLTEVFPDSYLENISMDDFLAEIFGEDNVERTPTVSVQVLNDIAKTRQPISRKNSVTVALVPTDFKLRESGEPNLFIRDNLQSTGAGGVDLTVRADIAGPVGQFEFTIFSEGHSTSTNLDFHADSEADDDTEM